MNHSLTAAEIAWGTRDRRILRGVGLEVQCGETLALLGPNGSGKSSLLRLLAGLRRPDAGSISVGHTPLTALSKRDLARRLALVEQEVSSDLDLLVRNVIELGRIPHRLPWSPSSAADLQAVRDAAEQTEITHTLDRRYRSLSGGERQRVQIARALAQEPELLLLDEPTNHLDVRHQLALMALVASMPVTTVVALHDLNLAAAYCDRVVLLADGEVAAIG
ncbi:ABC transporter ATP-binding protein, partial [Nocardioides dubius]